MDFVRTLYGINRLSRQKSYKYRINSAQISKQMKLKSKLRNLPKAYQKQLNSLLSPDVDMMEV